jgi:hypothetical protein
VPPLIQPQTSYSAEDSGKTSTTVEQAKEQRLTDLESLLSEYKYTIDELGSELDAIGGSSGSLGSGKTREQLQSEIEEVRARVGALENGTSYFYSPNHVSHLPY